MKAYRIVYIIMFVGLCICGIVIGLNYIDNSLKSQDQILKEQMFCSSPSYGTDYDNMGNITGHSTARDCVFSSVSNDWLNTWFSKTRYTYESIVAKDRLNHPEWL